jgi:hypothetical protein
LPASGAGFCHRAVPQCVTINKDSFSTYIQIG